MGLRRLLRLAPVALGLFLSLAACGGGGGADTSSSSSSGAGGSSSSSSAGGGGSAPDAGPPIDKAKDCADTFGDALTAGFGRIDGTVLAVVKPSDTQCAMPNDDHVILQVTMNGAVYRMVINVESTFGSDPRVSIAEVDKPLSDPPWSEGWHLGVQFDYVQTLGIHYDIFTPYSLTELSDKIADAITLGSKVSVYAHTSGGASAHMIHKNSAMFEDGAVVLDAASASPRYLLFRFDDQAF